MLTPTMKMKRNDLKKKYQQVLDTLYADAGSGLRLLSRSCDV